MARNRFRRPMTEEQRADARSRVYRRWRDETLAALRVLRPDAVWLTPAVVADMVANRGWYLDRIESWIAAGAVAYSPAANRLMVP